MRRASWGASSRSTAPPHQPRDDRYHGRPGHHVGAVRSVAHCWAIAPPCPIMALQITQFHNRHNRHNWNGGENLIGRLAGQGRGNQHGGRPGISADSARVNARRRHVRNCGQQQKPALTSTVFKLSEGARQAGPCRRRSARASPGDRAARPMTQRGQRHVTTGDTMTGLSAVEIDTSVVNCGRAAKKASR